MYSNKKQYFTIITEFSSLERYLTWNHTKTDTFLALAVLGPNKSSRFGWWYESLLLPLWLVQSVAQQILPLVILLTVLQKLMLVVLASAETSTVQLVQRNKKVNLSSRETQHNQPIQTGWVKEGNKWTFYSQRSNLQIPSMIRLSLW